MMHAVPRAILGRLGMRQVMANIAHAPRRGLLGHGPGNPPRPARDRHVPRKGHGSMPRYPERPPALGNETFAVPFDAQGGQYRESAHPRSAHRRLAVEAGVTLSWRRYAGIEGRLIRIDRFGASGKGAGRRRASASRPRTSAGRPRSCYSPPAGHCREIFSPSSTTPSQT
jgi:transketolase